jgi:ribulose-phosphate 3-epimerase
VADKRSIKIAPSILSADFSCVTDEIRLLEKAGADWIHLDVMDGHFVPNMTIGPPVVTALRKVTSLPFDVHLMIQEPDRYLRAFIEAGADVISVHAEVCPHLHRTVHAIRDGGARPGVVLNPGTPLSALDFILEDLDLVLIMTVNPGFGGQSFIPTMIPKIAALYEIIQERQLDLEIEVDGGINLDNIHEIARAGANVIVSGTGIMATADYTMTISQMRDKIQRPRAFGGLDGKERLSSPG